MRQHRRRHVPGQDTQRGPHIVWTSEGLLSHVEQDTVNVVTPELSSGEEGRTQAMCHAGSCTGLERSFARTPGGGCGALRETPAPPAAGSAWAAHSDGVLRLDDTQLSPLPPPTPSSTWPDPSFEKASLLKTGHRAGAWSVLASVTTSTDWRV